MWQKDNYQEQMLSYLGEMETYINRLSRSRQSDLNELYANLDATVEWLWRLIGASDAEWEGFRYPLELSCDRLQRAYYRAPRGTLTLSASRTITENQARKADLWKTMEMIG